MKKKVLSLVLSLAMVAGALTACGKSTTPATGEEKTSTPAATTSEEKVADSTPEASTPDVSELEPVVLKWYMNGNDVKDDKAVMAKVNEYLTEKINATIEPIWATWTDFEQNAALSLQGGDDVDIYFTCSWSVDEYNKFARDGYWVRLDADDNNLIEKYAQDTWDMLPDVLTDGATITGVDGVGVYAIPGYKDYATQNCWDINVPLLEKYGYTLKDVEEAGFYGFGDILAKVKAGEGDDFFPLLIEGAVLERMVTNSIIVTGDSGVSALLSYYLDPTDITKPSSYGNVILNKFATDEYKDFVTQMHEYYKAGYVNPAMANAQQANDARTAAQDNGEYLIGTQSYSRGYEVQASADRGFEVAMIPCTAAYVDTTAAQGAMMAVTTISKNPERAVMFLNLLNTDPYLMTLLEFGIEGEHYELNADGEIVFLAGRENYKPWTNGMGNITQLPPLEGQGVNFQQEYKDYYAQAKAIPLLGYSFDQTPVETEMGALANIAGQYSLALSTGFVDPAVELPKFLKALEDNGMQKVIDEANDQLNYWMENK